MTVVKNIKQRQFQKTSYFGFDKMISSELLTSSILNDLQRCATIIKIIY